MACDLGCSSAQSRARALLLCGAAEQQVLLNMMGLISCVEQTFPMRAKELTLGWRDMQ